MPMMLQQNDTCRVWTLKNVLHIQSSCWWPDTVQHLPQQPITHSQMISQNRSHHPISVQCRPSRQPLSLHQVSLCSWNIRVCYISSLLIMRHRMRWVEDRTQFQLIRVFTTKKKLILASAFFFGLVILLLRLEKKIAKTLQRMNSKHNTQIYSGPSCVRYVWYTQQFYVVKLHCKEGNILYFIRTSKENDS